MNHCKVVRWKATFFIRESLMLVHEYLFSEAVLFLQRKKIFILCISEF